METKVSIIVSVYNVEKYLKRCLVSLVNQTLNEIEIIAIDDGSTDKSSEILDDFAAKYPGKIIVKHTENRGVSLARNTALELANGEYIGFVDADDFVRTDMFEHLYKKAKTDNADIVSSAYTVFYDKTAKIMHLGDLDKYSSSAKENKDVFTSEVSYLWNKIFSRKMLNDNNITFEKFKIFEDMIFVDEALLCANKISKVDIPFYFYRGTREGSATTVFSEKFFDLFPALQILFDFYKSKNAFDEFFEQLLFVALNHSFVRHKTVIPNDDEQKKLKLEFLQKSFEFLNENFPNWKESDYYYNFRNANKNECISIDFWKNYIENVAIEGAEIKEQPKSENATQNLLSDGKIGVIYRENRSHILPQNSVFVDFSAQSFDDENIVSLIKEICRSYKSVIISTNEESKETIQSVLNANEINAELIVKSTPEYSKALALSKYIISNISLPAYFDKKSNQKFVFVLNCDCEKEFGKIDFFNIFAIKKELLACDFAIFRNSKEKALFEKNKTYFDYIKNKIAPCFYSDFKATAKLLKEKSKKHDFKNCTLVFGGNLYNNLHTDSLFSALINADKTNSFVLCSLTKAVSQNYPMIMSLPQNTRFFGISGSMLYLDDEKKKSLLSPLTILNFLKRTTKRCPKHFQMNMTDFSKT